MSQYKEAQVDSMALREEISKQIAALADKSSLFPQCLVPVALPSTGVVGVCVFGSNSSFCTNLCLPRNLLEKIFVKNFVKNF